MSGPSILVRVLGDLTGLGVAFDKAGGKVASTASSASRSFGTFINGLNQTGILGPFGSTLAGLNDALGQTAEHSKKIGPAMLGVGAAITGVGATLSAFGSKEQASHQQLKAAIESTGHSWDEYGKKIESTIKHQEKFGHTADQTQDAIRILTTATGDTGKALGLMNEAADLAAAKHISLTEAAGLLGKVWNGNTRLLKQFGIQVAKSGSELKAVQTATRASEAADKNYATAKKKLADLEAVDATKKHLTVAEAIRLRDAQNNVNSAALRAVAAHHNLATAQDAAKKASADQHKAVDLLGKKLAGQASAQADTFSGKMKAITATVEDQVAKFGQKYGPALQLAGVAMMTFGSVASIGGAEAGAGELAALWPLALIALAVAALIAVVYLLWHNWDTIWKAIKTAVEFVWNWIKQNWPLLLGILLGPIALAVVLILRYWDLVKAAAAAVVQWIAAHWQLLLVILTGPIGIAVAILARYWSTIIGAVAGVINWIRGAWNGFVGFVSGLPGRIGGILSGLFNAAIGAASRIIGAIQSAWNGAVSWIAGIPGRITAALGDLGHLLFDAGKRVIGGLIDGIKSKVPDVGGAISSVASAITSHLPFSPAKEGPLSGSGDPYYSGLAIGRSLSKGLTAAAGQVSAAMPRMLPDLSRSALATVTPISSAPSARTPAGPAVVINDAHFGEQVDIDLFMARAAWQLQRQRV